MQPMKSLALCKTRNDIVVVVVVVYEPGWHICATSVRGVGNDGGAFTIEEPLDEHREPRRMKQVHIPPATADDAYDERESFSGGGHGGGSGDGVTGFDEALLPRSE